VGEVRRCRKNLRTARSPNSSRTRHPAGFWVAVSVALLVTLAYFAFCIVLYIRADDMQDDKLWTRLVYIAGGLSALVATAFGWLFGREVHRAAAEHATKDAERARRLALNAHSHATAGRALAKAIKAAPESSSAADGLAHDAGEVALAASHLAALKRLARDLFPPDDDDLDSGTVAAN
jgi:hypothetical protein